jgi:hypothetical protein
VSTKKCIYGQTFFPATPGRTFFLSFPSAGGTILLQREDVAMTLFAAITLVFCYILIGIGCAKVLRNDMNELYYDWPESKSLIILLWPLELGRAIARASVYHGTRGGEYHHEFDAILHHLGDIGRLLDTKLTELSEVVTVNNPAWGNDSAHESKKAALISLYGNHLMNGEALSPDEAYTKAVFITDIRRHIDRSNEFRSETALRSSAFFIKEVSEKAQTLGRHALYKPMYTAIAIKEWKKGLTLRQNSSRAFDAYSGEYGYDIFIQDAAILYRLQQLGILTLEDRESGPVFYKLCETDLSNIRRTIFGTLEPDNYMDSDEYFHRECSKSAIDSELPFTFP